MKSKTKPKTASHTLKNTDKSYSENLPRPIFNDIAVICRFTDGKIRQVYIHKDTIQKMLFDEIANYEYIRVSETELSGVELIHPNNDQNSEKTS